MGGGMFHWFFWPMLFFWPFHGLLTLIVVCLILSAIFGRRRYYYYGHPWWGPAPGSRSDALATLEGRYARGEIDREEYLQKRKDLGG
jgi:putative membrane protein